MLKIMNAPSFNRVVKKLHAKDKQLVDSAIKIIANEVQSGEEKKGDLSGIFVYKFKMQNSKHGINIILGTMGYCCLARVA